MGCHCGGDCVYVTTEEAHIASRLPPISGLDRLLLVTALLNMFHLKEPLHT